MSGTRLRSPKEPATRGMIKPALILVAHGERGGLGDDRLVCGLVDRLSGCEHYRSVQGGFVSKDPSLRSVYETLSPGPVLLYPLFMSDGYFVRRAIPRALAGDGISNHLKAAPVHIATPFGLNPHLPDLVVELASRTIVQSGGNLRDFKLLLVAHGSKHDAASRSATEAVAETINRTGPFAAVDKCYLEEQPFLDETLAATSGPTLVLGLFIGEGLHGSVDLPEAVEKAARPGLLLAPPLTRQQTMFDAIYDELCAGIAADLFDQICVA